MPSTHTSLHYHVVFSTKNREASISPQVRDDLHAYLGGIVRGMKGVAYAVGGTNDHVHIFMGLKATHCLADVMREMKADSVQMGEEGKEPAQFFLAGGIWRVHGECTGFGKR